MSFPAKKTGGRMWHEARKQEKKIRGMLVDYRRRAERRRDYYEKIKSDPTQFLQLHGRPCKIHLDPVIAAAGDSPANMMPWQGNEDNLIDRFDVRAHLDWIPEVANANDIDIPLTSEERHINYERYRIIVQNEFLGVTEEKFLHQIHLEEQFGSSTKPEMIKDKKKSANNAAIGYNYETDEPIPEVPKNSGDPNEQEEKEDDDSDIDLDICVDVSQIEPTQAHEMNQVAQKYGLIGADYFSFLTQDFEEAETLRQARKQEEEKAMYSGRRSRRERRAFREKKMIGRIMSPPSYAARESPEYNPYRKSSSKSRSRSASPINAGQITYITSFGGEEETVQSSSQVIVPTVKKINSTNLKSKKSESPVFNDKLSNRKKLKSRSRSKSSSRSKSYRKCDIKRSNSSYSRSRKNSLRTRKYGRSRTRSHSRWSRSYSRSRSRGRSRSRSYRTRSRSHLRSKSRSKTRTRTQSNSRSRSQSRITRSTRSRSKRSHRSTTSTSLSSKSSKSSNYSRSRSRSKLREGKKHRISKSKSKTRSRSRSRSRSKSRSRTKSRSRSRTKSRSRGKSRSRSKSNSSSRSKSRSRSRSKLRSRSRSKLRSRSRSKLRSRSRSKLRSRSRSKLRSRSRSKTRSRSRSKTRSRSRSSCKRSNSEENKPAVVPRYYGRRGKSSSLELELSDDDKNNQSTPKTITSNMGKPKAGLSTNSGVGHKPSKITPQERLKKKMQALLNKQYKADKKAEQARIEKIEQQRQDREDEIREMSLKLRRKQRERRHRYEGGHSTDSHSSKSRSPSPERNSRSSTSRRDRDRREHRDRRSHDRDNDHRGRDRDHRDRDRARERRNDHSDRSVSSKYDARRRHNRTPPRHSNSSPSRNNRGLVDY